MTQAIDVDFKRFATTKDDSTNDQNSNNRESSLFQTSENRENSLFMTNENDLNINRDDKSNRNLMKVDSKSEKKANVKKKTLESDEVLEGEKEINIDKDNSIDVDLKSSKEENSKSDDIEDVSSSNSWTFIDNDQRIHKWRKCDTKEYQFIMQTRKNKYEILFEETINYKCVETFVKFAFKVAQIDYNDAKYTRAYVESFDMFMNVTYRESQTQSNKRKKLSITFAWDFFKDDTNEWLSKSIYRRIFDHKYVDDRITTCCIDREQTSSKKMSSKQWILKNIEKKILIDKMQSIVEVEFNNLAQKSRTIETLSSSKNNVINEFINQLKSISNEIEFNDQ